MRWWPQFEVHVYLKKVLKRIIEIKKKKRIERKEKTNLIKKFIKYKFKINR